MAGGFWRSIRLRLPSAVRRDLFYRAARRSYVRGDVAGNVAAWRRLQGEWGYGPQE